MKNSLIFMLAAGCVFLNEVSAASAQARLFCLSLRFQTATTKVLGQAYSLDFARDLSAATPNGELFPLFNPEQPSHSTYFLMHDPTLGDLSGTLGIDVPPIVDANLNGFSDFFESSQAVETVTTQGVYDVQVDHGTVTATWHREADTTAGTCKLHLKSAMFGPLVDYTVPFELLELVGPLTFTSGAAGVSGTIQLQQSGAPTNLLGGDFQFIKVATNRLNALVLQPGGWTNASAQALSFTNSILRRDENTLTNYSGFIDFADGNPDSTELDYTTWVLSIDDPNDANANHVPDFSDDPIPTVAPRPVLALAKTDLQLQLTLSGEMGRLYEVQEIDSLSRTNWTKRLTVTLTNDSQTVTVALPTNALQFWRARVL